MRIRTFDSFAAPRLAIGLFLGSVLLAAAGCTSLVGHSEPYRDFRVEKSENFRTVATPGKSVYLKWDDVEFAPEFEVVHGELRTLIAERKLSLIEDPNNADYTCFITLRFFDVHSVPDNGVSFVEKAGSVVGGFADWISAGRGPYDPPIPSVISATASKDELGGSKGPEWVLIFDIVVGERGGEPDLTDRVVARTRRVVGTAQGAKLTRNDAVFLLKDGAIPIVPKVKEGVPAATPPDPFGPSKTPMIAEFLLKQILP